MTDLLIDQLLSKFKFEMLPSTFQLGCTAKILNIHAQQKRAFNLAWALSQRVDVKDKEFAVVGAGIGGLTAAVAFAALGAKITLFEKTGEVLHLQRGNLVRYVHPNIATWPDAGAGYPLTDLPYMNWGGNLAGEIAKRLNDQWLVATKVYQSRFRNKNGNVEVGGEVFSFGFNPDVEKVCLVDDKLGSNLFDFLILAVGYGVEKTHISVTSSYWRNDDFAQPIIDSVGRRKILVSGTGDGALTEVLRFKLRDFQHRDFFEEIMFAPWLLDAKRRLDSGTDWEHLWGDVDALRQNYSSFFGQLRHDTEVVLNSKRRWFDSDAQVLHKLCVGLLIAAKEVTYKQGKLARAIQDVDDATIFIAQDKEGNEIDRASMVIQRQGTYSKLVNLFFGGNEKAFKAYTEEWSEKDEIAPKTYDCHSHVGFLVDELRRAHFENSYDVGFALIHAREGFLVADQIVRKLKALDLTFEEPNLGQLLDTDKTISFVWRNLKGALRLEVAEVTNLIRRNTNSGMPVRDQSPVAVQMLMLRTDSKFLLDNLLDDCYLPYHLYRIHLANNFPNVSIDDVVNTDTHVFMVKRPGCIEVHCLPGMHQAHKLLRVPTLIEIMGNMWSGQRLGGWGWAVQNLSEVNRIAIRGNEILR